MGELTYEFSANYKSDMHEHIGVLLAEAKAGSKGASTTPSQRTTAAERLTDAYVAYTGERPDGSALERLADYVLYDDLTWSHPDKMSIVEFPIMSERQADTRERKETLISDVAYGRDAHVGYKTVAYEDDSGVTKMHRKKIFDYLR